VDSREPSVRRNKDFSGVVVWLEPTRGQATPAPPRTVTIVQKGKRFSPHVVAIPVGATVDFPNFDPIFHNAFSNFAGQPFDTGLYPPASTRQVRFLRPGTVRVFCNIHAAMSAVIVVLETPWFTVTDAAGAFRIDGLPAGDYQLRVWHERASEATLAQLHRRLSLEPAGQTLPPIRISESGYLEIPHRNKYGKDYPPEPSGRTGYPGGRP